MTPSEAQRIATLARLALTPTEEHDVVEHFEKILTYVDQLSTWTRLALSRWPMPLQSQAHSEKTV